VSEFAAALRGGAILYPAIEAMHVLGAGLLLGAIVAMDLRLLGFGRALALAPLSRLLLPVAVTGLALALVSGTLLFVADWSSYLGNRAVWAKAALLLLGFVNVALLHARHWPLLLRDNATAPLAAALSLCAWIGVTIAGRLIAYV
jgi:hypothetical protein